MLAEQAGVAGAGVEVEFEQAAFDVAVPHGGAPAGMQATGQDIKRGFVYRRVPHITLKSIANNQEIDAIHAKWQPELDRVRGEINRLEGKEWEEWEIPLTPTLSRWEREPGPLSPGMEPRPSRSSN